MKLEIKGYRTIVLIGMLLALGLATPRADTIICQNGKVLKGIIDESVQDPNTISFISDMGTIQIPKARIREIKKESKAQGFIHLGQASMAKQDLLTAMRSFQQALDLEPNNPLAQKCMEETRTKISDQQRVNRADAASRIDKLGDQARQLMRQGEFKKAESLLMDADKLIPSPEQSQKLAILLSNMYLSWAEEREDKLDKSGAEAKLNLALAANPNNEKVIEKMLVLWEDNPQKRDQVAKVYETILERHPGDKDLRKKLADLYYTMGRTQDAEHHYMILYQDNGQLKGTEIESRIIELLDKLHLQYARQKDFDKAIYYYNLLSTISTETDPTAVIYYEYAKRLNLLKPNDLKGRLDLALYSEKNGLDPEALKIYREMINYEETKELAQAGLNRYRTKAMNAIQFQLDNNNFDDVIAQAEQMRKDFPPSPDQQAVDQQFQEKLTEAVGRVQAEKLKDRRQRSEQAKDSLKRADEFYSTALNYFNNLFNVERRNLPGLVSDRSMATQYFTYAIKAYEEALQIDPSLGGTDSVVSVHLADARSHLSRLGQRPSSLPENFGRPLTSQPAPVIAPTTH